jgi:hypothetical protein
VRPRHLRDELADDLGPGRNSQRAKLLDLVRVARPADTQVKQQAAIARFGPLKQLRPLRGAGNVQLS